MLKNNQNNEDRRNILSISEITSIIKSKIEPSLSDIWIKGEISNLRMATSGHIYFTIKDENAVISAVIFKGSRKNITCLLEDGIEGIFHGKVTLYEKRGNYQIIINWGEEIGRGDLHIEFEKLKKKLFELGWFDKSKKQPLPKYPRQVGIISSETGAALQDILRVSGERFNGTDIIIYPCSVQGQKAGGEIIAAINQANRDHLCDVLIVSRGGGSIEDLWPFNEEIVAQVIFNSAIPIVSGVGHEIDSTISDFVADQFVATPSAAAELVFPDRENIGATINYQTKRMGRTVNQMILLKKEKLTYLTAEKFKKDFINILEYKRMLIDDYQLDIAKNYRMTILEMRKNQQIASNKLKALNPKSPFERGFAIVRKIADGKIITKGNQLTPKENINIEFGKGSADATIKSIKKVKDQ